MLTSVRDVIEAQLPHFCLTAIWLLCHAMLDICAGPLRQKRYVKSRDVLLSPAYCILFLFFREKVSKDCAKRALRLEFSTLAGTILHVPGYVHYTADPA